MCRLRLETKAGAFSRTAASKGGVKKKKKKDNALPV